MAMPITNCNYTQVYKPVLDDHGHNKIIKLNVADCRKLSHGSILCRGMIYYNEFFPTHNTALNYINKIPTYKQTIRL